MQDTGALLATDPEDGFLCGYLNDMRYLHTIHALDNIVRSEPITPVATCFRVDDTFQLLFQISFKTNTGFVPLTFLCMPSLSGYFYFSEKVLHIQHPLHHRFLHDEDMEFSYVRTSNGSCVPYRKSPDMFEPANCIGLNLLFCLGMELSHPVGQLPLFKFNHQPLFF